MAGNEMKVDVAKEKLEELVLNSAWPFSDEINLEVCELSMFIYHKTGNICYLEQAYSTSLLKNIEYKLNEYLNAIEKGEEIYTYEVADIYFNGALGYTDYKKAFEYFSRAAVAEPNGDGKSLETAHKDVRADAILKLAIMYKKGLYVAKSYDRYKELVSTLYQQSKDDKWYEERFSIRIEMAKILLNEGEKEKGLELLFEARKELCILVGNYGFNVEEFIAVNNFIYQNMEFDYMNIRPADVTYLFNKEGLLRFCYEKKPYLISIEMIDGHLLIKYADKYYSDPITFMEKAKIEEVSFCIALFETYGWEVL